MTLYNDIMDIRIHTIQRILSREIGVKDAAEILGVHRKTIHKRKRKYLHHGEDGLMPEKPGPKEGTAWNRLGDAIENEIVGMAYLHKREGPLKLKDRLEEEKGIDVDQSTVFRVLKRKHVRYHREYEREKKEVKLYSLEIPGEEIQIDTCFPFGRHRKFVIYSAIDDCTRMVYSRAYENANIENTKDFVNRLIKRFPFAIKAIRSDQGREFAKTFTEWLENRHINHIKNEPYHPEHNGKVERYHQTENNEEIINRPYLISIEEANYNLWQYISFYNYERKHRGLSMNGRTPDQKLKDSIKNVTLILQ